VRWPRLALIVAGVLLAASLAVLTVRDADARSTWSWCRDGHRITWGLTDDGRLWSRTSEGEAC
jgi:hypothetical protein